MQPYTRRRIPSLLHSTHLGVTSTLIFDSTLSTSRTSSWQVHALPTITSAYSGRTYKFNVEGGRNTEIYHEAGTTLRIKPLPKKRLQPTQLRCFWGKRHTLWLTR